MSNETLNHPLFSIWLGILSRCNLPSHPAFKHYGGRGITVAPEWMTFATFADDMGPRPSPGHSVERKEVNASYSKDNCCWATTIEQGRNTRRTHWLTHDGVTLSLPAWAERVGIDASTLSTRLQRGWPIDVALTTPTERPMGMTRVRTRQTDRLCAEAGISRSTFYGRLRAGMSEQDALTRRPSAKRPPVPLSNIGVAVTTYYDRLKRGWTPEEAATTPARRSPLRLDTKTGEPATLSPVSRARMVTYQGETLSVTEWARRVGLHPATLIARLNVGTPIEIAMTAVPCYGHRIGRPSVMGRLREAGIKPGTYYARLKLGLTVEQALSIPVDRHRHSFNVK